MRIMKKRRLLIACALSAIAAVTYAIVAALS